MAAPINTPETIYAVVDDKGKILSSGHLNLVEAQQDSYKRLIIIDDNKLTTLTKILHIIAFHRNTE